MRLCTYWMRDRPPTPVRRGPCPHSTKEDGGSANVMRDNKAVGFGFVNVNVNVVVAPSATVDFANAFVKVRCAGHRTGGEPL